jgi:glyoxylase-like metal-dependent hydrolase (beta-lactamase superfamily II)
MSHLIEPSEQIIKISVAGMEIRRVPLRYLKSNMYVLIQNKSAILIDPNESREIAELLYKLGIANIFIFLTHEHFDHTSGVNYFIKQFDSKIICQSYCSESIAIPKKNRPMSLAPIAAKYANPDEVINFFSGKYPYSIKANIIFDEVMDWNWGSHRIKFIYTPGHTKGSSVIIVDNRIAFTGDYMILGEKAILRYPGGSTEDYQNITLPFLLSLQSDLIICPGHGKSYKKADAVYENGIFSLLEKRE